MVGMGSSSKSGTSDEPIDTKFIPVFGGAMLGIGALLFGLSGLIILLPEPQYSAPKHKFEMLTPDEAAKAAHERLAKDGSWSTDKYGNTIYIAHKPLDRNKVMPKLEMLSSIEASKAARARLARSGAESFSAEKELKAFNVLPGIWICNECGAHYGRKEEAENCFDGVCPKAKQFTGGRQGESVYQSFMRKHGHSMRRQGYDAESFSADDREKWGHSLSEVIYDDGGNRICGCEDDDPVDDCCIIDPRHPIYNEDNLRKAINNLSEIGRSVLNEIFEINPDEDFDGDDLDMWLEYNWWWMDDFSREYWQFAPKRQTKIGKRFGDVWDWLDEYGNLSDQKWSKLLGPDDPRVKPPPTCAGCDSEDIEFYHDYYGGFCGGDCFDGYLEENKLENYSRTEKDLDAESFAYESEELIPVGTKVRSYDFWPHDETCYKEGVIVDHAPSPSCSPTCMHYHIRTTKVIRRGKSRPVDEGEIFMTHPYADMWDQEYPGQLAPHIQVISTAFPSTSTI